MKQVLTIIVSLIYSAGVCAQETSYPLDTKKQAAFVQLLGPGIVYSVGYEGVLWARHRHGLVANVGGTVLPEAAGFHGGLSYLFFIKRSALEAGFSVTYLSDEGGWLDLDRLTPVPNIGYRYYFKKDKIFIKAGADFFISPSTPNDVFPYPYAGVGFRF